MHQLLLTFAVTFAALALPASASAAPYGGLTPVSGTAGCVQATGADGCAADALLSGPNEIAISPDGKHLYAVSIFQSAVIAFNVDPVSGAIGSRISCANPDGSSGCEALGSNPGGKLNFGYAVDVSPDGRNVYVIGRVSQTLLTFGRNTSTGALTYQSCDSTTAVTGCTLGTASQLDGGNSVEVSPDGKSVYTTAANANSIIQYDRDPTTGDLNEIDCLNAAGSGGCGTATQIAGPFDVEVSPDGNNLYVAAADGVANFSRSANGSISPLTGSAACIGSAPCAIGHDIDNLNKIAISPDGKNAYTASTTDDAVAVLSRAADGSLSQSAGAEGSVSLAVASSVLVSPDGRNVYAGAGYNSAAEDSLAAFDRAADGSLTQQPAPFGCFNAVGSASCTAGRELNDVISLAIAPQGTSFFTGAYYSNGVAAYSRELPPTCTDSALQTLANTQVTEVPLSCSDPNGGPTTLAVSTAPAHGTVSINQGTRRARFTPTSRYHGSDSFKFTASDGSLASDSATAQIALTDKIGPLVEFGSQKVLRLSKSGSTKVKLKCPKTEVDGCPNGRLTIGSSRRINITLKKRRKARLTLGRVNFKLAAGQSKSVRVKLRKSARRVVRRLRNVRVNLTATSKDPGANTGKTTKATRIKAPRRKTRRR